MPRLRTNEEFVALAEMKHNKVYDYSLVQYKGKDVKVDIGCTLHGMFSQTPHNHLKGQGCPSCSGNIQHTTQTFIDKATSVHGDTYDYSRVVYTGAKHRVEIICKEHGAFWQQAGNHLGGMRCGKCHGNYNSSTTTFVEAANAVHGGKYTYDLVDYQTSRKNVVITCPIHGDFKQTPATHLNGSGCQKCMQSGYRVSLPGTIYILKDSEHVKVGITNRSARHRAAEVSRSSGAMMSVDYFVTFSDGQVAHAVEKAVLAELSRLYPQASGKFDGATETFICSNVSPIRQILQSAVSSYFAQQ